MEINLYYYCSIGTLELILKTEKIRFSSLGTVDDRGESLTAEDLNLGKVCFFIVGKERLRDTIISFTVNSGFSQASIYFSISAS